MVCGADVADYLALSVESVPAHGCDDRVVAEFVDVGFDSLTRCDTFLAIRIDNRRQVVAYGFAVWQVDFDAIPNRDKGHITGIGAAPRVFVRARL